MSMTSEGLHLRRQRASVPRPGTPPQELRDWSFRVHTMLRERLQRTMEAQKMDYTSLAERVGYTPLHVRRILTGRSRLSVQMYLILASALRLDPPATLAAALSL